jgi:hypothetical protein
MESEEGCDKEDVGQLGIRPRSATADQSKRKDKRRIPPEQYHNRSQHGCPGSQATNTADSNYPRGERDGGRDRGKRDVERREERRRRE